MSPARGHACTDETHWRGGLGAEAMSVSYSSVQVSFMRLNINAKGEIIILQTWMTEHVIWHSKF